MHFFSKQGHSQSLKQWWVTDHAQGRNCKICLLGLGFEPASCPGAPRTSQISRCELKSFWHERVIDQWHLIQIQSWGNRDRTPKFALDFPMEGRHQTV